MRWIIVLWTSLLTFQRARSIGSGTQNDQVVAPRRITVKTCNHSKRPDKVLIVDVDNCIYSESDIQAETGNGIEKQIIQNTYDFGKLKFNLTRDDCDAMYHEYGSTIEGIRQMLISEGSPQEYITEILHEYYRQVYDRIDMTCLLPDKDQSYTSTGYNHAKSRKRQEVLREMMQSIPYPIFFASNSPKRHVLRVLSALGLRNVPYEGILSPDRAEGTIKYPTKYQPDEFFRSLLEKYGSKRLILIDDSERNIQKAESIGIRGINVNNRNGVNLEEALSMFIGHIAEYRKPASMDSEPYKFSDVEYLQSKYHVDMEAINCEVWNKMQDQLFLNVGDDADVVRIVDIGAGLLSMLDLMILGAEGKRPLIERMKSGSQLYYIAYESNKNLFDAIQSRIRSLGFIRVQTDLDDEYEYHLQGEVAIKLILRLTDFSSDILAKEERPHMVVGCCFADLFEPNELATSVARFVNYHTGIHESEMEIQAHSQDEILLYFPITFSGTTQFVKPHPFGIGEDNMVIPSDTLAFQLYSKSLIEQHGHNLDPQRIVEAFECIGANLLGKGISIWHIDSSKDSYLWKTMLYFFANSGAFQIMKMNFDSVGWVKRAERAKSAIRVMNQDLLFSLRPTYAESYWTNDASDDLQQALDVSEEIVFEAPYKVGKTVKLLRGSELGPNQVEVKSICSLISSGTELKIFKGLFDEAQLDVNIKGMAEETMKYPLSYGYSLVGTVTRCGKNVLDSDDLIGKVVFTFSSHSTHAIVDRNTIHIVPDGISAEDAMFLPSVETAVSIVHDANVRIGEKVSIYGQGLIGLLVTGILSSQNSFLNHDVLETVTTFDTISNRLAMSSEMGSSQALLPENAADAGPFDVSIEVSGNARALQSAIDNTQNGSRIIVGSWYGNSDIQLKLGIEFHRSHKTIKTSQVSTIPAELSGLWTKEKRFALSWELVRLLKPSKLITRSVTLDEAQEAYESLDNGEEVVVSFRYGK